MIAFPGWRPAHVLALLLLWPVPWAAPAVAHERANPLSQGGHWAQINGHRLYYQVRGSGPVLLLLHGGGSSGGQSFERQLDLFAKAHEIIAPDQVGQGLTPDIPGPLSYTNMLGDTIALLRHLKIRSVDVMGFSDGGILALMLAAAEPQRVRRLVVSGVNVAPEGLNAADLQEMRGEPPVKVARNIGDKLRELWLHSPTPAELNMSVLAHIEQPVLLMSGDHDAVTLEHTLEIYKALPNSELYVLPGTSHDTFGGRPEWVNPIAAAFLARSD